MIQQQVPLLLPCVDLARLAEPRFVLTLKSRLILTQLGWLDRQCVQGAGTYSLHDANVQLLGISASRAWVARLDSNEIEVKGLASPLGVAARCFYHCKPRVAQRIRGIQTYRCLHLPPAFAGSLFSVLHLKKDE